VVFEKDGKFRYGWEKLNGAWVMAAGTFSMDAKGKIVAKVHYQGVALSPWYVLKNDVLQGPRGPKPSVVWKREQPK
jgi:hypothetical protein